MARGGPVARVPVETEDEIGNLAQAFNNMAASLKGRERKLKESRTKLRLLSRRVLQAQEEERRRLARELHDELGQNLAFLKIQINTIVSKMDNDQGLLCKDCKKIEQYIDQIIENVRRLSTDLSPSVLEDLGLTTALRMQSTDFAKLHSLKLSLKIADIDNLFSQEAQINLYRFYQETLTNISKHARATKLSVNVGKKNGHISFLVEDDGQGFDPDHIMSMRPSKKGMGLTTLEERARMLGGSFAIWSKPGKGTRISLAIPMGKG